jgi:predicted dehydrogenase
MTEIGRTPAGLQRNPQTATLKLGIIGLGNWGRRLVESVQGKSDLIRFVAAVTGTPAKAETFATKHGFQVSSDLRSMLADASIEAVVSAGPAGLHAAHSLAVIEAGKPVLAVKPMATKRADAEALRAAARKHGVLLALGYNRCFYPATAELRRRVAAGDLGTLLHMEGNFCVDRYFKLKPGADWKTDKSQVLAGALADHPLYAMIELLGPIAEVISQGSTRAIKLPITDTTATLLRFANGASGLLTAMGATATYERTTVFGSKGWAEIRNGAQFTFQPIEGKGDTIDFPDFNAEKAELEAFAAAVTGEKPFPVPLDDAVHSVAVLEAIDRAAKTGQTVKID